MATLSLSLWRRRTGTAWSLLTIETDAASVEVRCRREGEAVERILMSEGEP